MHAFARSSSVSRAELLVVVALVVACTKPAPPPPIAEASAPVVDASIPAPPRDAEAASTSSADECDAPLADPKSGKSIGHTSVVFKLELVDGKKVVFKPHSKKGPNRYKGEIAAWRLAKLLDVPHVVPVCARTIPKAKLEAALAGRADAATLFREQAIVENEGVRGAVIPWVDDLGFVELEKEPLASQWRLWLKKGTTIPPDKQDSLARETSMMVVFDYVTGNWDRLSGGNVGLDRASTPAKVLFIDNDGAFFESPPKDGLARNKRLLDGTERLSKSLIARLRTVGVEELENALGKDSDGKPLLSDKVIAGVMARTKEVLAHADAKIAANGEAETLYFR